MKTINLINVLAVICGVGFSVSVHANDGVVKLESKQLKFIKGVEKQPVKTILEKGVHAYFDEVISSNDAKAPISCGIFRIEKGKPLTFNYNYDDIKMVMGGSITFSDGTQTVEGKRGDVLFFPKGSTITFSSKSSGLAWACGQRGVG